MGVGNLYRPEPAMLAATSAKYAGEKWNETQQSPVE
jgi:hypothetical protein